MAGILDPKERIMDVILTTKGRLDLVNGNLQMKYASFTDGGCFYENDGSNVASSASLGRVYFEAFSSDSADIVIPETNDMGNLNYTLSTTGSLFSNGKMYTRLHPTSSIYVLQSGSVNLYDGMTTTMSQSLVKFDNLFAIGSEEPATVGRTFDCAPREHSFFKTNNSNALESLKPMMFDDRLTTLSNYNYLPPITNEVGTPTVMGSYPRLLSDYPRSYESLKEKITTGSQVLSSRFSTVGFSNDIIGQVFRTGESNITKLVAIDAGEFVDENAQPIAKIYYLGNIYTDELGVNKFVRELSIIFSTVTGSMDSIGTSSSAASPGSSTTSGGGSSTGGGSSYGGSGGSGGSGGGGY